MADSEVIVITDSSEEEEEQEEEEVEEEEEEENGEVEAEDAPNINTASSPPSSVEKLKPIRSIPVYTSVLEGLKEETWWLELKAAVPEKERCKNEKCTFAPPGHKRHAPKVKNYSPLEERIIIQYLIHYGKISFGKGIKVWTDMNEQGYLTHRPPQSLNNHFKRHLIHNIKYFKLPPDIEEKFIKMRN